MRAFQIANYFLAILGFSLGASIQSTRLVEFLKANDNLEFLGRNGLKFFFTDNSKSYTFDETQAYCKSYNLKAATFVDKAEYYQVVRFLPQRQRLWTSAVNANVFKWDDGQGEEMHSSLDIVVEPYDHSTCISIYWEQMFADPCQNQLGHNYSPLCELQIEQQELPYFLENFKTKIDPQNS